VTDFSVPKLNLNTLIAQKEGPARRLLVLPALLESVTPATAATSPTDATAAGIASVSATATATAAADDTALSLRAKRKKHISLDIRTLTDRTHFTDDSSTPVTPHANSSDYVWAYSTR